MGACHAGTPQALQAPQAAVCARDTVRACAGMTLYASPPWIIVTETTAWSTGVTSRATID
jgi:hypothetical protein